MRSATTTSHWRWRWPIPPQGPRSWTKHQPHSTNFSKRAAFAARRTDETMPGGRACRGTSLVIAQHSLPGARTMKTTPKPRRGNVVVLTVASLTALLALVALAVDIGYIATPILS